MVPEKSTGTGTGKNSGYRHTLYVKSNAFFDSNSWSACSDFDIETNACYAQRVLVPYHLRHCLRIAESSAKHAKAICSYSCQRHAAAQPAFSLPCGSMSIRAGIEFTRGLGNWVACNPVSISRLRKWLDWVMQASWRFH